MDLTRWFARLVLAQVILGLAAFCLAEGNPGLLLFAGTLAALSWYVVEGPRGAALPQWAVLMTSLGAVALLLFDLLILGQHNLVLAMGHFTIWLQVVQLYSRKANRDYALLLALSVMLMLGASILDDSPLFAVLLAVYGGLALFTVLLLQIKATADLVHQANSAAVPTGRTAQRPQAVVGRGVRGQFRLMGAAVGLGCAAVAVLVFLFLPRGSRSQEAADLTGQSGPRQVGFSTVVHAGSPPQAALPTPVLNLTVRLHGQDLGGPEMPWLLRGVALDWYDPTTQAWRRDAAVAARDATLSLPAQGLSLADPPPTAPCYEAAITLRAGPFANLFTLQPVTSVRATLLDQVVFNDVDQQLGVGAETAGTIGYEVRSAVSPPAALESAYRRVTASALSGRRIWVNPQSPGYARGWDVEGPRVQALALSIIRQAGLDRDPASATDPRDPDIARVLASYLREHYTYSLNPPPRWPREDPVVAFLLRHREGHCELFASGLAALARSLGLRARVISGFLAHEYNGIGGYYVVRERDAHAWVEIDCGETGWRSFDASPPGAVSLEMPVDAGVWGWWRELMDHVQFTWLRGVVAYDRGARRAVVDRVSTMLRQSLTDRGTWLGWAIGRVSDAVRVLREDALSQWTSAIILLAIVVGLASLMRTLLARRRRRAALRLDRVPPAQRRTLARHLSFYLAMLELLERHGYHRPRWQTPAAFARGLAQGDPSGLAPAVALTDHFYELRFALRPLDAPRQADIRLQFRLLEESLARRRTAGRGSTGDPPGPPLPAVL